MKSSDIYKIFSTKSIAKFKSLILNDGTIEGNNYLVEVALPYTVPSFVKLGKLDIHRSFDIDPLRVLQGYFCHKFQMQILGSQYEWKQLLLGSFLTSVYSNSSPSIIQSIQLLANSAPTNQPDLLYTIVSNQTSRKI